MHANVNLRMEILVQINVKMSCVIISQGHGYATVSSAKSLKVQYANKTMQIV